MDMPRSGYETPTLPVKPRQSQRDDEAMDFEPAGGGSQPLGTPSTIWDEATIPDSEDSSASQQDTNPDSTHPPNARLQLSEAGGPGDPDGDQQEGPRDHRTLHHGQRALLSAAEGRVPETPESDQHASQASEHPGTQGSDDPKYTPPASLPPGSSRAAFLLMDSQRDSTSPNKKTAPRTGPGLNGSSSPSSEGLAHQGSRCRSHITDSDPNSPGNGSVVQAAAL
ncbi:hypothetical protein WJX72_011310 [[Myrmecia] bisecta]|uniref:Uncharacterized protein n=1 Tax=[Myrmecia] bisecta TaxID=41462 RepID=A0AAW1QTH6_9CHLO